MEIRITPTIKPRKMIISGSIMLLNVEVLYSTSSIYCSETLAKKIDLLHQIPDNNLCGEIINQVSAIAESEHLKAEQLPPPDTSAETDGYVIQRIFLSGEYLKALRTLHKLEEDNGAGMIRSLSLKTTRTPEAQSDKKLLLEISFEREK